MKRFSRLLVCLALPVVGLRLPALAQEEEPVTVPVYSLLNLETAEIPPLRQGVYHFDIRASAGKEGTTYYGPGALIGIGRDLAFLARATFADRRLFTASAVPIRRGGHEAELAVKWRPVLREDWQFALLGGVLFPHTALRRAVAGTLQPILTYQLGGRTLLVFNPKAVLGERVMVTLGGGVHYRFNPDWEMFGELQGAIAGENGFRTDTGLRRRQEVWGFGIRYTPFPYRGQVSLDLGVTNGLGRTTGYSAQAGLAGSTSFFVQLIYRK
ncbi:MAG: hypothetical protein RMJ43_01925 [Chloroherpetonaceae bacterium]|nr:hypothetical protein [Chthonomonadaceae bacterium]MDW8206566.1 hypothetical protein [Chloroherpetonaceae bacterium]